MDDRQKADELLASLVREDHLTTFRLYRKFFAKSLISLVVGLAIVFAAIWSKEALLVALDVPELPPLLLAIVLGISGYLSMVLMFLIIRKDLKQLSDWQQRLQPDRSDQMPER